MAASVTIRVQSIDFDIAAEIAALTRHSNDIGAVVSFSGICRAGKGDNVISAMTLEHYPGMVEAEIARHVEQAVSRWPLNGVTVIHRYGRVVPGDNIVLVLTASAHREAAFQAAEFLMDYLKTNAPFWKAEERLGDSSAQKKWVDAQAHDDEATARWKKP
ncbi:MAG: molybdenum cofactor biosynthesis protein MoaE [Pseudomonadota bacterium]